MMFGGGLLMVFGLLFMAALVVLPVAAIAGATALGLKAFGAARKDGNGKTQ